MCVCSFHMSLPLSKFISYYFHLFISLILYLLLLWFIFIEFHYVYYYCLFWLMLRLNGFLSNPFCHLIYGQDGEDNPRC